ncbi:hypothetical protein ASZ90_015855 [hydrocarbon metagenome]|uniref:Uncharacterized protein n=1 Tax=hydrocarbon metagenome TaxID=938273 RepID=A0A0W8F126_9ZZZZ
MPAAGSNSVAETVRKNDSVPRAETGGISPPCEETFRVTGPAEIGSGILSGQGGHHPGAAGSSEKGIILPPVSRNRAHLVLQEAGAQGVSTGASTGR